MSDMLAGFGIDQIRQEPLEESHLQEERGSQVSAVLWQGRQGARVVAEK